MEIELKSVKMTKSKILQMRYTDIPFYSDLNILGWVNLGDKRYVILKMNGAYYRTEFIKKIENENKSVQFTLENGGYEFPILSNIKCQTYNGGWLSYSPNRNDEENIKLYDQLISFKSKTEIAGQIYY